MLVDEGSIVGSSTLDVSLVQMRERVDGRLVSGLKQLSSQSQRVRILVAVVGCKFASYEYVERARHGENCFWICLRRL